MDQAQATRLLSLGLSYVARYDAQGNLLAHLRANDTTPTWPEFAVGQAVRAAGWRDQTSGQIARDVASEEIFGILTILVPVPGGGWVVGAVERWLLNQTADQLAAILESAVQREFGPVWAPIIAVGVATVLLVLVAALSRSS
jgi:hypothetical protein